MSPNFVMKCNGSAHLLLDLPAKIPKETIVLNLYARSSVPLARTLAIHSKAQNLF